MSDVVQEPQKIALKDILTILRPYLTENIAGINISEQDYLDEYAELHYEWVEGVLIKMSPSNIVHQKLFVYFIMLFEAYFEHNPIGNVQPEPFTMKISGSYRQPDLQIILNNNPYFTDTGMQGPADICIEIVSPESVQRDYETKYALYEQGGVREYWIIDPRESVQQAKFYRLIAGKYEAADIDDAATYITPLLPKLNLHVPTLWQEKLPSISAIVQNIAEMFSAN